MVGACIAGGGMHGRYYEIQSMSEQYAFYWNGVSYQPQFLFLFEFE